MAERMNNEADKLASTQHGTTGEWSSKEEAVMLPKQKLLLQEHKP